MTFSLQSSVLLAYLLHLAAVQGGTRFSSHVRVNTPARSFSHGVGDPLPSPSHSLKRQFPSSSRGYPRVRPAIPFNVEDTPRSIPVTTALWQNDGVTCITEVQIPLLPPSPYKVNSPDPESLWPEGLFLPPFNPQRFGSHRRADTDPADPYLLEGSEAIAAVSRAKDHGLLYFHDIPHIQSLLENQQLRIMNHLDPHILGSIRYTWPFYRT